MKKRLIKAAIGAAIGFLIGTIAARIASAACKTYVLNGEHVVCCDSGGNVVTCESN